MKKTSLLTFLTPILVSLLVIILGCFGGGGGGGGSPGDSGSFKLASIVGEIDVSQLFQPSAGVSARISPAWDFSGALVFLEENILLSARPDSLGRFMIEQVPPGSYHLIVRLSSVLASTYKIRVDTPIQIFSAESPASTKITFTEEDKADSYINILVIDQFGLPIPGTKVTMWGESFTYMGDGIFQSPPMTPKAAGSIFIEPPQGSLLQKQTITLIAGSFVRGTTPSLGATVIPQGVVNRPPNVYVSPERTSVNPGDELKILSRANDPESDDLIPSWTANIGTFSQADLNQATWKAPNSGANAVIIFAVTEKTTRFPVFTSKVRVAITVASGSVAPPGVPSLVVDIQGTATVQIPGNAVARYDAVASGGYPASYTYSWFATNGQILSGQTSSSLLWRSPTLSSTGASAATISVTVSDGTQQASKTLSIPILNAPNVSIISPVENILRKGANQFVGQAADFDGSSIDVSLLKWYIATSSFSPQFQAQGKSFTYNFREYRSYQVLFTAQNAKGAVATTSKTVTIENTPPSITILKPLNNSTFELGKSIDFVASTSDYEDGVISNVDWSSNISGTFTTGLNTTYANLATGQHLITALARDRDGKSAQATASIIVTFLPFMDFIPASGGAFFSSTPIAFTGAGTDSKNIAILPTAMNWFRDGASWKTGVGNFAISPGDLTSGSHIIRLEGTDSQGKTGSIDHTLICGISLPGITQPASGATFNLNAPVACIGTPTPIASLTFAWISDPASTTPVRFGQGANATISTLSRGIHQITYIGTDSQNISNATFITILVNSLPTLAASPANNSVFFGGQTLNFSGVGTESNNVTALQSANLRWYLDPPSAQWATGSAFSILVGGIATGPHTFRLDGIDQFGAISSLTRSMTVGYNLPLISSPAAWASYPTMVPINFQGTPSSSGPLTMAWWASSTTPLPFGVNTLFGNNTSATYNFPLPGTWTLNYLGTDSQGLMASFTRQVYLQSFSPTMAFIPPNNAVLFGGQAVSFLGVGTESDNITPIPASRMTWFKNGALWLTATSAFSLSISPGGLPTGSYNICLEGSSTTGIVGDATNTMYVGYPWAAITAPASGAIVPPGPITFTGTPDSSGSLVMAWKANNGVGQFGTGSQTTPTFNRGKYNITFVGTDSQNFATLASISLTVNANPTTTFTPPTGLIAFSGNSIPFIGSGTDASGTAISPASLTWYINGAAAVTATNTFIAGLASFTLGAGSYKFDLTAVDDLGFTGTTTHYLYYGFGSPTITAPPNGSLYPIGSLVNFTGTPNSSGSVVMTWYRSDGVATLTFGPGSPANSTFLTRGKYVISYSGTDDFGMTATTTISLTIDDAPVMDFIPPNNAKVFANTSINFNGNGTDSSNIAIPVASLSWYKSGVPWQTATSSFLANPGVGVFPIRLEGIDDLGIVGSVTHTIDFSFPAPGITYPASGIRFDTGALATFTATPAAQLNAATFTWILDGTSLATNSTSYASNTIASGWHSITYYGTDSGGNISATSTGFWVNTLPTMSAIIVTSPTQLATGPGNIPIYARIGGVGLNFSGGATDFEVGGGALPAQALSWFIDADPATKATGIPFNWLVSSPATLTITCKATDSWGWNSATSSTIWVWDWEQYSNFPGPVTGPNTLINPTAIGVLDATNLVVADTGNNRLIKLTRVPNGTGLTVDGDLNGAATDTVYAFGGLVDCMYYTGQIYTLETGVPGAILWFDNPGFLLTSSLVYPLFGKSLTNPSGLTRDATAYYVADTGAGRVRRIDATNGDFFAEQAAIISPFKIRLDSAGTYLYISDNANNRIYKYLSDLNPLAKAWDVPSNSPYDLGVSAKYVLVSDATNQEVRIYDPANGNYIYKLGDAAASSPTGLAFVGDDLYIVENTNPGKVTRIRSNGW